MKRDGGFWCQAKEVLQSAAAGSAALAAMQLTWHKALRGCWEVADRACQRFLSSGCRVSDQELGGL